MPQPTIETVKSALDSLMNKDAASEAEKNINNLILDLRIELVKLLKP